jgi:cell division transport system ATP-binding protein
MYLLEELNKIGTTVVVATHNESLIERFKHPCFHVEDGLLSGPGIAVRPARKPEGDK